jgi:large subunit ribosomal protein L23
MPTLHEIIVKPVVTEKTSEAYQARGEYTFRAHPQANKGDIRRAIEQLFGVHVTGVWTSNQRGKAKRMGKSAGRRTHWKKAIVKLRAGESIAVFEG